MLFYKSIKKKCVSHPHTPSLFPSLSLSLLLSLSLSLPHSQSSLSRPTQRGSDGTISLHEKIGMMKKRLYWEKRNKKGTEEKSSWSFETPFLQIPAAPRDCGKQGRGFLLVPREITCFVPHPLPLSGHSTTVERERGQKGGNKEQRREERNRKRRWRRLKWGESKTV